VGDDDVVEGRIGAPEARKSDLDNHVSGGESGVEVGGRDEVSLWSSVLPIRCLDVVHRPGRWKFWAM
jgi:hypothetical protein